MNLLQAYLIILLVANIGALAVVADAIRVTRNSRKPGTNRGKES